MNSVAHFRGGMLELDAGLPVVLRPRVLQDAAAIFKLIQPDPNHLVPYNDYLLRTVRTVDDVREHIISEPRSRDRPVYFSMWSGQVLVGNVMTKVRDRNSHDIGYWVGKEHVQQGYASAAVKTTVRYLFEEKGTRWIDADVLRDNEASVRTLLATGFSELDDDPDSKFRRFEMENPAVVRQRLYHDIGLPIVHTLPYVPAGH